MVSVYFTAWAVLIVTAVTQYFWAVIQVPTGPASKHTMYCTLSVSSVYYKVCGLRYTRLRLS